MPVPIRLHKKDSTGQFKIVSKWISPNEDDSIKEVDTNFDSNEIYKIE